MNALEPQNLEFAPVDYDPFALSAITRIAPSTEPQREVWLADQLGWESSLAYNESVTLRLSGSLDVNALEAALQALVQRHEALRATFSATGEQVYVSSELTLDIPIADLSYEPLSARELAVAAAKQRVVNTSFNLAVGPLFRAELLKLEQQTHLLLITAHHIVCDGWSFGILFRDLAALYARQVGMKQDIEPALSFADYAEREQSFLETPEHQRTETYWLSRFETSVPALDLPTDHSRSAWRTYTSAREDRTLDAELVAAIRKMGAHCGAGLFATLLGGFAATLHRIAATDDVVIGTPAAGQSIDDQTVLVGHCVNLLPLRIGVDAGSPISTLIAATQTALFDALEHQRYTFGSLLKKLAIPRDPSRLPLVSVMFNLDQSIDANLTGFPELAVTCDINPRSYENFEMFVNAVQVNGAIRLECQYNSDLFDRTTIQRWLACYEAILKAACHSSATALSAIDILSAEDRTLLGAWSQTSRPYSTASLITDLIEAQVGRNPHKTAITWQEQRITAEELDNRANRLAHSLRARGAQRGALVGLHVSRSPDMIAAAMAVLKTGAAYVPLDPSYPADRLTYMVQDAGLQILITEAALGEQLSWAKARALCLDGDSAEIDACPATPLPHDSRTAQPNDAAYVIYTSGSTGKPKGVEVPHRSVVNFLESMAREPGLGAEDRLVAVTTLSFDIAVNELFLPLVTGAEIVLASREQTGEGMQLRKLVEDNQATVMQATPATWRMLIEAGWHGNAQFKAMCGGEALGTDLAQLLLDRTGSLWNMYGPTETTVWSSCTRIDNLDSPISIGRPIANTSIWILDDQQQRCPIGIPGEIWIGGDGVTLGYLNRPELTNERFIPDRFSSIENARLYRTGDRGRWRSDGMLEHLGRLDFQVKVRGYRIELGEIEAALASHPDIIRAVALAREDRANDVRLVAYLVMQPGKALTEATIRSHLKTMLPDYMVPQHFIELPTIPCLPNGKVDRKALPAPEAPTRAISDVVAPTNELERRILQEMQSSLGVTDISIHDDFFELGGHSLLAAQLTSRLNRELGSNLSMRTLFEAPTVARLALAIGAQSGDAGSQSKRRVAHLSDQRRMPASLMQERLWFLEKMYPGRVLYHAPSVHRLRGPMDIDAFNRAFHEMVRRQSSLRTSFERDGQTVMQIVHDSVTVPLFPAEDLSQFSPSDREARLQQRLEELTEQPFDLAKAPIFRAHMFRVADDDHILFFMPHHIIWDGWSFDIVYTEMSELYAAYCERRPSRLPELPVSYGDFSAWHREWVKSDEVARQMAFWRERLGAIGTPKPLPTDKPRTSRMSGIGSTEWIRLDQHKTHALHKISMDAGTTMFVTLLSVYGVLLYDYARQTDLVIGTPVRNRDSLELESIMGYFNNLLPLQIEISPAETFDALIKRVKNAVIQSFAHPDIQLEQLSKELPLANAAGGALLYQALFSFQDARQRIKQWGDLNHEYIPHFQRGATEDLGMWFMESTNGLLGGITHNTDIFTSATAQWLHKRYVEILDAIIDNVAAPVAGLVGPRDHVPAHYVASDSARSISDSGQAEQPRPASESGSYVAPQSDLEINLAAVWERVLRVPKVGVTDNFFDLGGNSLQAVNLILEMEEATGIAIDLDEVLHSPTIGDIVRNSKIGRTAINVCSNTPVLIRPGTGKIPLFMIHDGFGEVFLYRNLAMRLKPEYSVYGLKPQAADGRFAHTRIPEMARAKVELIRSIQPHGPYLISGLCAGGVIAFETARQLQDAGEHVAFVGILDAADVAAEGRRFRTLRQRLRKVTQAMHRPVGKSWPAHLSEAVPLLFRKTGNLARYIISDWLEHARNAKIISVLRQTQSGSAEIGFNRLYEFAHDEHVPQGQFEGGDVVLFRATSNLGAEGDTPTAELCADPLFGWQSRTKNRVTAIDVPGGHSSMLQEPHVATLAEEMQVCIDLAMRGYNAHLAHT